MIRIHAIRAFTLAGLLMAAPALLAQKPVHPQAVSAVGDAGEVHAGHERVGLRPARGDDSDARWGQALTVILVPKGGENARDPAPRTPYDADELTSFSPKPPPRADAQGIRQCARTSSLMAATFVSFRMCRGNTGPRATTSSTGRFAGRSTRRRWTTRPTLRIRLIGS